MRLKGNQREHRQIWDFHFDTYSRPVHVCACAPVSQWPCWSRACGSRFPRIEGESYIGIVGPCGGHTGDYHFHRGFGCLYEATAQRERERERKRERERERERERAREPIEPQFFGGSLFPSVFFRGCPTKMVFPKTGSLFFQGH